MQLFTKILAECDYAHKAFPFGIVLDRHMNVLDSGRSLANIVPELQSNRPISELFWLMLCQWMLGIVLATIVTPHTWIGGTSFLHQHVMVAWGIGALVSAVPMMLAWRSPGTTQTRYAIAFSQAVWTCILIHLTGGRIETHFHAFASLAFLAVYRDWKVLVIATGVIGVDHFVRGIFWPISVYGVAIDSTYRFLEHVAWLGFMDVFLIASCFRHHQETFEKHHRQIVLEEQAKINEKILEVSRESGKAEIATGVLHNVGNVMNSVNISADMVQESLRSQLHRRLQAAHHLLEDHEKDLASFFQSDKRGKHFVPFLAQLSDVADELVDEIEVLREHLGHVNSVVASQQDLATSSGLIFGFDPASAVDSALKMTSATIKQAGIQVICQMDDVQPITTDKQRLVQALVNLLRNAKHAIEDSGQSTKQITIRLFQENKDEILIQVADSGIGIGNEDLDRIFQHGFSTRKDRGGHGFGLHHTICSIHELGGELEAASDGIGCGATFTVRLPSSSVKELQT